MKVAVLAVVVLLAGAPSAFATEPPAGFRADATLGRVASLLALRPVSVYCATSADAWRAAAPSTGDPVDAALGFVRWSATGPGDAAFLNVSVCLNLNDLAAAPNPTCPVTRTVRVTVTKRVRVKTRTGWRVVTKRIYVTRQKTDAAACPPRRTDAEALDVLAHEARHLAGIRNEAEAECGAVQTIARTATTLRVSEARARALATYAWKELYPLAPPDYRSPECRDGGALDLRPDSPVWP